MEKIQTLKGFKDIMGDEMATFRRIESVARKYFTLMGYKEIETPVLEKTELFVRSIGDTTDIVEKEMFTFTDLGGDSVTLRPEGTAGVVRAYLQSGMYARERLSKVFMVGPMFRHEKPQKGRFREFHQIDVEVFGVDDPLIDAEFLWMISQILAELKVRSYDVEVGSVGCRVCREDFRRSLVAYFGERQDDLCEDCARRLERNPLRIFDCKNEACIAISHGAPLLFDALCDGCRSHYNLFQEYVDQFGIRTVLNKRLVRGLDYYTRTVFEVTSADLGAQKAFIAGGRYDGLVEEMGGPKTTGTGFAIGVERLALISPAPSEARPPAFFFAYLGPKAKSRLVPLMMMLTSHGFGLDFSYEDKSLKAQMRYADNLGADYVFILGDDEIARDVIVMRNMKDKSQQELPLDPALLVGELRRLSVF